MTAMATDSASELSPGALQILMTAVRLAKDQQIQRVHALKRRLEEVFPGKGKDIDAAIAYWAGHVRRSGLN